MLVRSSGVVLRGSGGWSNRIEAALFEQRFVDERRTVEVEPSLRVSGCHPLEEIAPRDWHPNAESIPAIHVVLVAGTA